MTFYGKALLGLGVAVIVAAGAAAAVLAIINIISSKRIKARLSDEYGERPEK